MKDPGQRMQGRAVHREAVSANHIADRDLCPGHADKELSELSNGKITQLAKGQNSRTETSPKDRRYTGGKEALEGLLTVIPLSLGKKCKDCSEMSPHTYQNDSDN